LPSKEESMTTAKLFATIFCSALGCVEHEIIVVTVIIIITDKVFFI
jgi:hypothetical protein